MSSLQREARFVDLIQEPLDGYDDAQIGAAARDVLQGCAKVIQQTLGVQPIVDLDEGSQLEVPAGFDTGNYRMVGNVSGDPPFTGQLIHHGWQATKCELPAWSGSDDAAKTIAPVEVEVK